MSQTVRDENLEIIQGAIIVAIIGLVFVFVCRLYQVQTTNENKKGPEIEIKLNK